LHIVFLLFTFIIIVGAAWGGYTFGRRVGHGSGHPVDHARLERASPTPAATTAATPASTPRTIVVEAANASALSVGAEKARIIRSRDAEAATLRATLTDRDAALAGAKEESARYRQLVVDIETNAPPPILSGAAGPDDLKSIVGVGPVLERMLHNLGVMTLLQIASWSDSDIAEFDAKLPEFPGRIQRDQWVTQARALHRAKYGDGSELRSDFRRS
jgi:predicted flap endonuclease-1-like 5' DNA nuclease